jgi:hypothetical protein
MWKFADDTTVSEVVKKDGASELQETIESLTLIGQRQRFNNRFIIHQAAKL